MWERVIRLGQRLTLQARAIAKKSILQQVANPPIWGRALLKANVLNK